MIGPVRDNLSPIFGRTGFYMTIQVFADDSERDDFYTVAGYLAPIHQWQEFSPQWYAVLKDRPRLGFYRTYDALRLDGQFKGWTAKQRDSRIAKLAGVIPNENTFGVAAHLSKRDFKEFFTPNFLRDWDDPYYVCATYLIAHTCLGMRLGNNKIDTIEFIFDRQGKVGTNFKIAYEAMFKPMSLSLFPFLGTVRHEKKTDFLPLQAADMQAGWVRRSQSIVQLWTAADYFLSRIEQRTFEVSRKFLERLADYRRTHADEIKAFFDKVAL